MVWEKTRLACSRGISVSPRRRSVGKSGRELNTTPARSTTPSASPRRRMLKPQMPKSAKVSCMLRPVRAGRQLFRLRNSLSHFIPLMSPTTRTGKVPASSFSTAAMSSLLAANALPISQSPSKLCTTLPASR